jgi:L-fuconolactonase
MLQDLPERQWILKPELAAPIEAIRDHGLVFDALVRADQLNTLDILAERYPRLSIVLDHAGKPPFGNATALLEWRAGVQRIAARENVSCKLSGLLTELPNGVPRDRVNWCVDLLMDLFAPSRLLWGSDWPVATAASDYDDWLRQCQQRATVRHPHDVAAFFETNAQRIYGLGLHAAH